MHNVKGNSFLNQYVEADTKITKNLYFGNFRGADTCVLLYAK